MTGLPIEIRSLILNHLSSLSDLAALTRTCTAYHDVYAKTPAKYVSKIAVKKVLDDGGNLKDPLAAIWSYSRLAGKTEKEKYEGEYKTTAIAFLDLYRRAEETHYFDISEDELPIHESLALMKLQKTADYIIDDIVDWVSVPHKLIRVFPHCSMAGWFVDQNKRILPQNCDGSVFLRQFHNFLGSGY